MAAEDYRIRKATPEDLGVLPAIERAAAVLFADVGLAGVTDGDVTSLEDFRACQVEGLLWVAADAADRPVGFAFVEVLGESPHLDELDVHPDHGRRGLGAGLVRAIADWARTAGYTALTLTTFRDVPWNRPYYERLGFEVLSQSELTTELRDLVRAEARRGLDPDARVVMRMQL